MAHWLRNTDIVQARVLSSTSYNKQVHHLPGSGSQDAGWR